MKNRFLGSSLSLPHCWHMISRRITNEVDSKGGWGAIIGVVGVNIMPWPWQTIPWPLSVCGSVHFCDCSLLNSFCRYALKFSCYANIIYRSQTSHWNLKKKAYVRFRFVLFVSSAYSMRMPWRLLFYIPKSSCTDTFDHLFTARSATHANRFVQHTLIVHSPQWMKRQISSSFDPLFEVSTREEDSSSDLKTWRLEKLQFRLRV